MRPRKRKRKMSRVRVTRAEARFLRLCRAMRNCVDDSYPSEGQRRRMMHVAALLLGYDDIARRLA